jgi:hypothetical protein
VPPPVAEEPQRSDRGRATRNILILLLAAAASALGACGGSSTHKPTGAVPGGPAPEFQLSKSKRYAVAKSICATDGPTGLRKEFIIPGRTAEQIAHAFSEKAPKQFQQTVYKACLDGFRTK